MAKNTLYFFECEEGFVADNGQDDVKNGSVESYPFDTFEEEETVSDVSAEPSAANESIKADTTT